jgi:demethoxyubiquinone hydroxylase (CLK1/Coq7/Cat5 family)
LRVIAAKCGDAASLGFVVETERQVEAHLAGHLNSCLHMTKGHVRLSNKCALTKSRMVLQHKHWGK